MENPNKLREKYTIGNTELDIQSAEISKKLMFVLDSLKLHQDLKTKIQSGFVSHRRDLFIHMMQLCQSDYPEVQWSVYQTTEDGKIIQHTDIEDEGNRGEIITDLALQGKINRCINDSDISTHLNKGCIKINGQIGTKYYLCYELLPGYSLGVFEKVHFQIFITLCEILLGEEVDRIEGMYFDKKTGCRSKAFLDKINENEQEEQFGAAIVLDINYLKIVNDTYGHAVGDQLIEAVGKSLINCVRSSDGSVIHVSGDEFTILIKKTDNLQKKIDVIIEKLQNLIGKPIITTNFAECEEDIPLDFTFDYCIRGEEMTLRETIKSADEMMLGKKGKIDESGIMRVSKRLTQYPKKVQPKILLQWMKDNPDLAYDIYLGY